MWLIRRTERPGKVLLEAPSMERLATKQVFTSKGPVIGFQPQGSDCFHFRGGRPKRARVHSMTRRSHLRTPHGCVLAGVPFAASTAGANRFRAPQPREPWTTPLECFRFGAAAHQPTKKSMGGLLGAPAGEDTGVAAEDCLHLKLVVSTTAPNAEGPMPVRALPVRHRCVFVQRGMARSVTRRSSAGSTAGRMPPAAMRSSATSTRQTTLHSAESSASPSTTGWPCTASCTCRRRA